MSYNIGSVVVIQDAGNFLSLKETKGAMAANNVDLNLGNYFAKTISVTTTITTSNVASANAVSSFILDLTNGGSATITWQLGSAAANTKWASGTAPTLTASGRDILGFFTYDAGATWNGMLLAKDIK